MRVKTVYRYECGVCHEHTTSAYCETWAEWQRVIAVFETAHKEQHEEEARAMCVRLEVPAESGR